MIHHHKKRPSEVLQLQWNSIFGQTTCINYGQIEKGTNYTRTQIFRIYSSNHQNDIYDIYDYN